MNGELPVLVIPIIAGIIGAGIRIAVQVYRDKQVTQTIPELIAEVFLGAVGGGIAFLLGEGVVASIALGFAAPDAIENLLGGFTPKPSG